MLTWVEISAENVEHNIRQFKKLIGEKKLLMPVIKSNAYGHGFFEIAKICVKNRGVDKLCVVSLDEAADLIKAKIKKPILILSIFDLNDTKINLAIKNSVAFPLYTVEQAKKLNALGEGLGKKVTVHIKIDTGAARVGFLPAEIPNLIKKLKKLKYVNIEGLWSHFASSETDEKFTSLQLDKMREAEKIFALSGIKIPVKHMACSAAAGLFPNSHFNAIRLGLSLYGLYPAEALTKKIKLKPVLSWKTTIIQIKNLPAGAKVGYGGSYITTKPTRLAILPVGYFDGYDRRLSNKAWVIIKGKKCPVRGRICMNLMMVDVTEAAEAKTGDVATLIGSEKNNKITAENLAKIAGTINYEIVSRINPLILRTVK